MLLKSSIWKACKRLKSFQARDTRSRASSSASLYCYVFRTALEGLCFARATTSTASPSCFRPKAFRLVVALAKHKLLRIAVKIFDFRRMTRLYIVKTIKTIKSIVTLSSLQKKQSGSPQISKEAKGFKKAKQYKAFFFERCWLVYNLSKKKLLYLLKNSFIRSC